MGTYQNNVNNISSKLEVIRVNVTIQENKIIEGAKDVLRAIRPDWTIEDISFKLFTDGITNKLVGCFYRESVEDVVLIRIYGNKTDLLIDRKAETKNILMLHNFGFAPRLYATFENGLAYEYVPGVTLKPETVILPQIWKLVARRMAEIHRTDFIEYYPDRKSVLESKVEQFLALIPNIFTNPEKHSRISKIFPSVDELRADFDDLLEKLRLLKSPVVFSHNDLLLGNVIYTESQNKVTFIDYEYADYNYQGFDIGNHFTEFAGIDEIDYARYPSKEFQYEWLKEYLLVYNAPKIPTDGDIKQLYIQVNQFALAAHFLWTLWALIQCEHSLIDFDFIAFGENRYCEYLAKKKLFLSLE